MYDYEYDMEDLWGDYVTVYGYDDGPAWVSVPNWAGGKTVKEFSGEQAAYGYAYDLGFRD